MHELLESHHKGEDWRIKHRELCLKYEELLDEEKDYYGNLPQDCHDLMRAYVHYYQDDPWRTIETEFTIEVELPNGVIYRGKVDIMFENQYGLWLGDHKTHKTLPDINFRLLDAQSALYLWAALKKYDIQGFVWNYLRTEGLSRPKAIQDGSRLSKVMGDTDYHTYGSTIKQLLKDKKLVRVTPDIKEKLAQLKAVRYVPGEPQTSPFFRRDTLEKDSDMLRRVATENYHTVQRIQRYPFDKIDAVERVADRSCSWCSYKDLCTIELMGGNPRYLRTNNFRQGDPMEYYQDRSGDPKGGQ